MYGLVRIFRALSIDADSGAASAVLLMVSIAAANTYGCYRDDRRTPQRR